MPAPQNEITARPLAGLYWRTQRQTRFWGWSSQGWGKRKSAQASHPAPNLAEWLRQAHAELDGANREELTSPALEPDAQPSPREGRRIHFVCNRRMIGLLIR